MSTNISIVAYAGKNSKEFQKHYKAVLFCMENGLSYPKETSEFFKGKIGGDDLEDVRAEGILRYIEDGIEVDLPMTDNKGRFCIKVSEIPRSVDEIMIGWG